MLSERDLAQFLTLPLTGRRPIKGRLQGTPPFLSACAGTFPQFPPFRTSLLLTRVLLVRLALIVFEREPFFGQDRFEIFNGPWGRND